jgi:hypothetical protein
VIVAKLLDPAGPTVLLGLTYDDLAALCAGESLHFDAASFALPPLHVTLIASADEERIKQRVLARAATITNPRS